MLDLDLSEIKRTGTSRADKIAIGPPAEAFASPSDTPLASLARDFALFNHGCFHTHGGMPATHDVVAEFVERHPDPACQVAVMVWPDPLFRGIDRIAPARPQDAWDRRIFLCPLEYWHDLSRHLRAIAILAVNGVDYSIATHQILGVPDRYALATTPYGPPPVLFHVFGVDSGPKGRTQFVPRPQVGTMSPAWGVVRIPGNPEVAAIGAAVVGGASNPFDAVESAWPLRPWLTSEEISAADRFIGTGKWMSKK